MNSNKKLLRTAEIIYILSCGS